MKNFITIFLLAIALISCESNSAQSQHNFETLAPNLYQQKMDELKSFQLVDVRTSGEFEEEHLINAVNIDYNGNDFATKLKGLDNSKPTFIYCLSGGRSASALGVMAKQGFKEVYNLQGGIMQWKGDNFKVTAANDAPAWKGMTKDDFLNLIPDDIDVIVDFKAPWCGPCKQLKPILEGLEKEFTGKLKVIAIDVDEHKSLADDMRIKGIPYLIHYQNGKQVKANEGFLSKKEIVKFFDLKK